MTAVYGSWCGCAPVKLAIATVTGWVRSLESWLASRNSFHEAMNARIAVVKRPGAASGRMTLRKACPGVHPSTRRRLLELPRHLREEGRQGVDVSGSTNEMSGMISAW